MVGILALVFSFTLSCQIAAIKVHTYIGIDRGLANTTAETSHNSGHVLKLRPDHDEAANASVVGERLEPMSIVACVNHSDATCEYTRHVLRLFASSIKSGQSFLHAIAGPIRNSLETIRKLANDLSRDSFEGERWESINRVALLDFTWTWGLATIKPFLVLVSLFAIIVLYHRVPESKDIERLELPPHLWRIHGHYYNLESFVDNHPGGRTALVLSRGSDCTQLFEAYHVFNEPRKRLAKYAVEGIEVAVQEDPSFFHCEFRNLVKAHFFGQAKWAHKAKWSFVFVMSIVFMANTVAWYFWLRGSWVSLVAVPVSSWLLMVNTAHAGSHFAYSGIPFINGLLACFSSPLFFNKFNGYMLHIFTHLQHPRCLGIDADPAHTYSHLHPFARHGKSIRGLLNLIDEVAAWLVSGLVLSVIHPIYFIFILMMEKVRFALERISTHDKRCCDQADREASPGLMCYAPSNINPTVSRLCGSMVRNGFYSNQAILEAVALWLCSVAVIVIPFLRFNHWGKAICFGFGPYMLASVIFTSITKIRNAQAELQSDRARDALETDTFKLHCLTSIDYSTTSIIWRFMTGGLNFQSLHRVYPGMHQSHFIDLYPAFIELCTKHGCVPAQAPSFFHAFIWHWKQIYTRGPPAVSTQLKTRLRCERQSYCSQGQVQLTKFCT